MNAQTPEVPSSSGTPTTFDSVPTALPELSNESMDRIEEAVFARIADERTAIGTASASRSRTRRRRWLTAGGVAAAFAAGVLATPPILGSIAGSSSIAAPEGFASGSTSSGIGPQSGAKPESALRAAKDGSPGSAAASSSTPREIIQTGSATIRVDDVRATAESLTALAEKHGGRVESLTIGTGHPGQEPTLTTRRDEDHGWLSLRVPSADLSAVIAALGDYGKIEATSIGENDVTETAVDLRAQIAADTASVQRLTELMAKAGTVSELLEAEVALTDRQAKLASAQQQLKDLESQVAMSSLQISLTRTAAPAADPGGFGDGVAAGWAGLIASLNALVLAAGFLLPWLGVALMLALLAWGIVRLVRVRKSRKEAGSAQAEAPIPTDS